MSENLSEKYHRIRRNLLQQRRYYIKRGISESNLPKIPSIPKTITEASVRRLENIIVSPEKRKLIKEYRVASKQYQKELGEIWRIDFEKEIPSYLKEIEIKSPEKATAKNLSELKRTVKRAKTYKKREKKKAALERDIAMQRRWREQEKREIESQKEAQKIETPEPEEVLPKPIDPYDESEWEDWEEGPPRNYEAEEQAVIENLKQSHPEMFYPAEEDVVTDNMEETLIDFGLYDMVEEELSMWEPKETWAPATQSKKARDVDSALSIFYGAVDSDGKATVAKRLNEYGADIQHILDAICYDSDQENVRFNLNQFSAIVRNKAISLEDNMRLTESSERLYW